MLPSIREVRMFISEMPVDPSDMVMQFARRTLSDAEIKSLPTLGAAGGGIEIVPAKAGVVLNPLLVTISTKLQAGYGNISDGSYIFVNPMFGMTTLIVNDSSLTPPRAEVTALLGVGEKFCSLMNYMAGSLSGEQGWGGDIPYIGPTSAVAQGDNALRLAASNSDGDFEDGHANNTIEICAAYIEIPV